MSRGFIVGISIVLMNVGLPGVSAQDWNVADDFSVTENPNGAWSYGWSPSLTSGFTLFDEHSTIWGLSRWKVSWGANAPVVLRNETGLPVSTCCTTWDPGQLSLHPSQGGPPNDAYAIVRWMAPESGVYGVSATFDGIDYGNAGSEGTSTTVHVMVNGTSHFDDSILGVVGNHASATYSTSVTLTAGDTVDFVVGDSGGDDYDTTALEATVSLAPTLPAVSEWGMMVMVLLLLTGFKLKFGRKEAQVTEAT